MSILRLWTGKKKEDSQIHRIQSKLDQVRKKKGNEDIFGAKSHGYRVSKVKREWLNQFLDKQQISLPEEFYTFLTEIGIGAGPYYGVYPLEKMITYSESSRFSTACILRPGMDKEEWNQLVAPLIYDEDISDEEYDAVHDRIFGGMLCFGTQGCEYNMYIVLQGEYRGRIVYTADIDENRPFFFTYEAHFLDWYERWLDEILADMEMTWFGTRMPGNEAQLMEAFQKTANEGEKARALDALFKFRHLSEETVSFLKDVAEKGQFSVEAVQLICKTSLNKGHQFLVDWLESGEEEKIVRALQDLNWYAKPNELSFFVPYIRQVMPTIKEEETVRFAGYVLEKAQQVKLEDFRCFLCHESEKMRETALYATKSCAGQEAQVSLIQEMIDGRPEIFRKYILYWGLVPDKRLLPLYEKFWPAYREQVNFRQRFEACLEALDLPLDYFEQ